MAFGVSGRGDRTAAHASVQRQTGWLQSAAPAEGSFQRMILFLRRADPSADPFFIFRLWVRPVPLLFPGHNSAACRTGDKAGCYAYCLNGT